MKETAKKYLHEEATPGETEKVLEWFDTEEGQAFLDEYFDQDAEEYIDPQFSRMYPDLESGKLFSWI